MALILGGGCTQRMYRTPEKLHAAYMEAIERDDPSAAYALLSPEVRASVPREQFLARWSQQSTEHQAVRAAPGGVSPAVVYRGTTVHTEGRVLAWAAVGEGRRVQYLVESGLPTPFQLDTPKHAILTFVAALREADDATLHAVLHEDLAAALREDWEQRATAIEAALDRPGAIELSPDHRRAELRYAQGRALRLEQGEGGWQVTGLE